VQACFTVEADACRNHDMRRDILPVINRAKIRTINFIYKTDWRNYDVIAKLVLMVFKNIFKKILNR